MKSDELHICESFLDRVVGAAEGGSVSLEISPQEQDALQSLLKVVSGLTKAADVLPARELSTKLSTEQQSYLATFNDMHVPSASIKRRGQKFTHDGRKPSDARSRLKCSIRKAMLANRFMREAQSTTQELLDEEMSRLTDWDAFNVNAVAMLSGKKPLQSVGYAAFVKYDLVQKFDIVPEVLSNFLASVESHYLPNPYHNSTHAADVTQNVVALIEADELATRFTDLEILAMLLSTVVHDIGHPGWNNAFLAQTQDEQAIIYNDTSINENMSLSLAFKILQYPECNILAALSREDYFYVRKLVIDIVLSTDMAYHRSIMEQFISSINAEQSDDWDSWKAVSRTLAMKLLVHCADLGNPCKPPRFAGMWTQAVYTEFFRQGDAEREAGLPVSPLFDRDNVSIHASQATFLDFVVSPCYKALAVIAPKAAERGLHWIARNLELWQEVAAAGLQHGVIAFDTPIGYPECDAECVHISPEPSVEKRMSSTWGTANLLASLLLEQSARSSLAPTTHRSRAASELPSRSVSAQPSCGAEAPSSGPGHILPSLPSRAAQLEHLLDFTSQSGARQSTSAESSGRRGEAGGYSSDGPLSARSDGRATAHGLAGMQRVEEAAQEDAGEGSSLDGGEEPSLLNSRIPGSELP